jgi:hypothetical protein
MIRRLALVAAALSIAPSPSSAADPAAFSLGDALRAAGSPTIPAAWAGIWATADSTHDCGNPTITGTDAGFDTLCTGSPVFEDDTGLGFTCTGTADDVSANVTCTVTFQPLPGCTVDASIHLVATRNGNNAFATRTTTTTFTPPNCAFQPDTCEITETTLVRVGPEPSPCSSPVAPSTWGSVKASYR